MYKLLSIPDFIRLYQSINISSMSFLSLFDSMELSRGPSIERYAGFILSDRRVIDALVQIADSDRMAQHFLQLSLENVDAGERRFANRYYKALNYAKEQSVRDIITKSMPESWVYSANLEDIAQNTTVGQPSYEDLPLILLWYLSQDTQFMPYLLTGKLAWFGPLPIERTQQFVFALFLWLKMDARYDAATGRAYYVEAPQETSSSLVSTVNDRERFIELFKSSIQTDLWNAEDYKRQHKHGVIIRLRFSVAQTGQIVVQSCGEKTPKCNTLYLVTADTIVKIGEAYLNLGKLKKTQAMLHFPCHYCGNQNACLFISVSEKIHFYCDKMCLDADI